MDNRTKLEIAGVTIGVLGILFDVNGMLFPEKPVIVEKEVPIYIDKEVIREINTVKEIEVPVEVVKEVVVEKIVRVPVEKPDEALGVSLSDNKFPPSFLKDIKLTFDGMNKREMARCFKLNDAYQWGRITESEFRAKHSQVCESRS